MQRVHIPLAVLLVFLAVGISACGSGSKASKVSTEVSQLTTNTAVQKVVSTQEAKVKSCAKSAHFKSHSGREKFLNCVLPQGAEREKVKHCIKEVFLSDILTFHHKSTKAIVSDATKCVPA